MKAIFSHRKTKSTQQIQIGDGESYIPLCRYHYLLNNLEDKIN